eukprot:TRINITY_DN2314_c0_g1_i1.p1 TRINITY_DN2314_c0_g1~~TRINITY_DN2314_c0_g1_i1.p1  ORF type:complete len:503 (+),score=69.54 TRINITY_DN2314_c0_g1_i1:191-1699(+)
MDGLLANMPASVDKGLIKRAVDAEKRGDFKQAIKLCTQALEAASSDSDRRAVLWFRSAAYLRMEDYGAAMRDLVRANELPADNDATVAAVHMGMSSIFQICICPASAMAEALRALRADPSFPGVQAEIAKLRADKTKLTHAQNCPNDPEIREILEQALSVAQYGEPFEHAHYLHSLGEYFELNGNLQRAIGLYEQCIPVSELATKRFGWPPDEQVCAANPKARKAYDTFGRHLCDLGVANRKLGRYEKAVGCYERSLELLPFSADKSTTLHNLMRVYQDLGKRSEVNRVAKMLAAESVPRGQTQRQPVADPFARLAVMQAQLAFASECGDADETDRVIAQGKSLLEEVARQPPPSGRHAEDATSFAAMLQRHGCITLLRRGKFADGIREVDKLFANSPDTRDDVLLYVAKADSLILLKRYSEAAAVLEHYFAKFSHANQIDPQFNLPNGYASLGLAYHFLQKNDLAEQSYASAVAALKARNARPVEMFPFLMLLARAQRMTR